MQAWSNGHSVDIRSPNATRPWQHVLEPLSGYLCLADNLFKHNHNHGEAYNFGPSSYKNYPVSKLIDEMAKYWDQIKWNDVSTDISNLPEAGLLKLNCDKALFDLKWHSVLNFEETIKMTVQWYKEYYKKSNKSMHDFTINQIEAYTKAASSIDLSWAKSD